MNELENLKQEIEELKRWKASLEASFSIPLNIDQAFRKRFLSDVVGSTDVLTVAQGGTGVATITGILLGAGTTAITGVAPLAGAKIYYVSDSSGGTVNRKLTFTSGILTSET